MRGPKNWAPRGLADDDPLIFRYVGVTSDPVFRRERIDVTVTFLISR